MPGVSYPVTNSRVNELLSLNIRAVRLGHPVIVNNAYSSRCQQYYIGLHNLITKLQKTSKFASIINMTEIFHIKYMQSRFREI